jgi:hypothetical protein
MPNPTTAEPIATTAADTAAPQDALSLLKSDHDAGIDLGALGEALAKRKAQVLPHQGAD